jgi:two-component system sensor histidine kinase UhpB
VEDCVDTVQHTLERVRQLSLSLRPPQLDDLGLAAALRSHLDRQARVAGLQAHFEIEEAPQGLAPETETACFRVAQEAINNVLRHARARNLWVRLYTAGGRLAISVRDDGRGFDMDSVRERSANGSSLGLIGMEERMALAGGSFELRSAPGQGTVLLATFPLGAASRERALG